MFLLKCFQAFGAAPSELPDTHFMTTPDGVSATSLIFASASVHENTRVRTPRQHFFSPLLYKVSISCGFEFCLSCKTSMASRKDRKEKFLCTVHKVFISQGLFFCFWSIDFPCCSHRRFDGFANYLASYFCLGIIGQRIHERVPYKRGIGGAKSHVRLCLHLFFYS